MVVCSGTSAAERFSLHKLCARPGFGFSLITQISGDLALKKELRNLMPCTRRAPKEIEERWREGREFERVVHFEDLRMAIESEMVVLEVLH